jgi:hypothetical protein
MPPVVFINPVCTQGFGMRDRSGPRLTSRRSTTMFDGMTTPAEEIPDVSK